jgi:hypothetical protein
MSAIQTSLPRTAPAKAAIADGIGLSEMRADMPVVAVPHLEYRLECPLFRNGSNAPGIGSEVLW